MSVIMNAVNVQQFVPAISKFTNQVGMICLTKLCRASATFAEERRLFTSSSAALSACCSKASSSKWLNMDNLNPAVPKIQYAVRGPVLARAIEIMKELQQGGSKYPFKEIIRTNIGDAHAVGQKPITYLRQLMCCCVYPQIMDSGCMPCDVVAKAKELLASCGGGSCGAYSQSTGIDLIRKHVAKYIEERDKIPSSYENIILSTGASESIKHVLNLFANTPNSGVMIPLPQYPLYSATLDEFQMTTVYYYLDEDNKWALNLKELERSYNCAKEKCTNVRAIVVINPGNPTGSVLSRENIEGVIKFAHKNKLFVVADEVYQHNIYEGEFHSFKKVVSEMGAPYAKEIEMASYFSCSKGYMGECGVRGGYCELYNMDKDIQAQLYKKISVCLCSPVLGQICMSGIMNHPRCGDPSYEQWDCEKNGVLTELAARAKLMGDKFNTLPGFKCNPVQGAMYAFPSYELPPKAIEAAKAVNQVPDVFFCFALLNATGICVVPGSGFGQREGTWHFRTTLLPPRDQIEQMLKVFGDFYQKFLEKYK